MKKWKEIAKSDEGKFTLINLMDTGVKYSSKYRTKDPLTYDGKLKRNDRIQDGRIIEWDGRKVKERMGLKVDDFVDDFVDENDRFTINYFIYVLSLIFWLHLNVIQLNCYAKSLCLS